MRYQESEAFKVNIPMVIVELIRTTDNGVQTTGKIYVNGDNHFVSDTLERAYKDNRKGVSCIPEGKYRCEKKLATKNIPYEHVTIIDVPNRAGIAIHKGNFYTHSRGCILLGKGYKDINNDGELDVLHSKVMFDEFMKCVPDSFILTIRGAIQKPKRHEESI